MLVCFGLNYFQMRWEQKIEHEISKAKRITCLLSTIFSDICFW